MLRQAIRDHSSLYVLYTGGERPNTRRPIEPISWMDKPHSLRVQSGNSGQMKTYLVPRIRDCRDAYWSQEEEEEEGR